MIPAPDKGRFFTFGRVFSGKMSTGAKVRIMGSRYISGQKDLDVKSVQRTVIYTGKKQESVEDVTCENTVAMIELDQFITKNATLTSEKEVDAITESPSQISLRHLLNDNPELPKETPVTSPPTNEKWNTTYQSSRKRNSASLRTVTTSIITRGGPELLDTADFNHVEASYSGTSQH